MRRTKIIATVGPSSQEPSAIASLIASGVDVFRLNFSHGSREGHQSVVETIRAASRRAQREVAILQDLSGPKIRTGSIEGGGPLALEPGQPLEIRIGVEPGHAGVVSTPYAPLAAAVKPGDRLLLDDGRVELEVQAVTTSAIRTRVVDGGSLGEHKGINAPNVALPAVGVTAKDETDLRFGLALGVDLVALSFVQSREDIDRARAIIAGEGGHAVPVIAKLERPEAIERLDDIAESADALMVARGDLGLELPLEQVPQVQKQVIRVARDRGVPVIVATQVLESMRTETRPTRAEVSDAAGAVDAGADAIMLSGETAIGEYPVRAVQMLDTIIRSAEAFPPNWSLPAPAAERPDHLPALCDAAVTLAARGSVDAIVAVTYEGRTARLLSARRPRVPIYALTGTQGVARQLSLWWGVHPECHPGDDLDSASVLATLRATVALPSPATVVVVSASPDLTRADVNFVRLFRI